MLPVLATIQKYLKCLKLSAAMVFSLLVCTTRLKDRRITGSAIQAQSIASCLSMCYFYIIDLFDALYRPSILSVFNPTGGCFMRIDIQARGFDLTEGLRDHTVRRLQFALGWASHDVRTVRVRLFDINGPRGGEDKRCRIQVAFPGTPNVVIEDTEADLYVAIDRAADRAERAVTRRLERLREHHHDRLVGQAASEVDAAQDAVAAINTD
jgi:ribosomal subunit interface protein